MWYGKSIEVDEGGGGGSYRILYRSFAKKPVHRNEFVGFLNLYLPLGGKFLRMKCVIGTHPLK